MIRVHCTKKLWAKLPVNGEGRLMHSKGARRYFAANDEGDAAESLLSGWHANLILIQRRQCVLFVHDRTRFPVFLPALKKDDLAALDDRFADGFMNTLLKTGADDALMDRAHAALAPLVCDTECNRSVQGTMTRMADEIAYEVAYTGEQVAETLGYRTGARHADRPCRAKGVKDCIWPAEAMGALLGRATP